MSNTMIALLLGLFVTTAGAEEYLYTFELRGFESGFESRLARIEPETGRIVEYIGDWFSGTPEGLTYDPVLDTLLMSERFGGPAILAVDRWSGERTLLAEFGVAMRGLGVHPDTADIYGMDLSGGLYRVNRETYQPEFIADALGGAWHGLAFAPDATLFATRTTTEVLATIDLETGFGDLIGPTGFDYVVGLSFDADGTLFGSFNDTPHGGLITIDSMTGTGRLVGNGYASGVAHNSLAFAPIPTPGSIAFLATLVTTRRRRRSSQ